MSRIWRYVLKSDAGYAPCIDDGILTLCTCKPGIRMSAVRGDWVMGFIPKRLGIGRVAWVGCVKEVLPMGDYELRFRGRRDVIYSRIGWYPDGREELEHYGGSYHNSAKAMTRDARGRNALVFEPFWYWGKDAPLAPKGLAELAHYYVGQTTRNTTPETIERLQKWVSQWEPGVHGAPRDAA